MVPCGFFFLSLQSLATKTSKQSAKFSPQKYHFTNSKFSPMKAYNYMVSEHVHSTSEPLTGDKQHDKLSNTEMQSYNQRRNETIQLPSRGTAVSRGSLCNADNVSRGSLCNADNANIQTIFNMGCQISLLLKNAEALWVTQLFIRTETRWNRCTIYVLATKYIRTLLGAQYYRHFKTFSKLLLSKVNCQLDVYSKVWWWHTGW